MYYNYSINKVRGFVFRARLVANEFVDTIIYNGFFVRQRYKLSKPINQINVRFNKLLSRNVSHKNMQMLSRNSYLYDGKYEIHVS